MIVCERRRKTGDLLRAMRERTSLLQICASEQNKLNSTKADMASVLFAQVDVGDLADRNQYFAASLVSDREDTVAAGADRAQQFLFNISGRLCALQHDLSIHVLYAYLDLHGSSC